MCACACMCVVLSSISASEKLEILDESGCCCCFSASTLLLLRLVLSATRRRVVVGPAATLGLVFEEFDVGPPDDILSPLTECRNDVGLKKLEVV